MIRGLEELTTEEACEVLMLNPRRYYRWLKWQPKTSRSAWNRITAQEEAVILKTAKDENLNDLRAAGLMVYGHDSGQFHCSISTVQRVLKSHDLQPPYAVPQRKKPAKPDIRELMREPKKVFSYDATDFYLTNRLRVIVIPLLDLCSRKFIHELEAFVGGEDFRVNSSLFLCQNR